MTSLADRLRGVLSNGPLRNPEIVRRPGPLDPASGGSTKQDTPYDSGEVLGGEWCESDDGRFLVVDRSYSPGHRHGWMSIADGLPPSDGVWPRLSLLADGASASKMLFVDLETTGIAGGAGTYAFLVGCAWFDQGRFRVRQFFLTSFVAERALLHAVTDVARTAGTVVTYNGKTFDLPLVETRFTMHRMATPFATMPHIDMLHPARRLWRGRDPGGSSGVDGPGRDSCRLSVMEQSLCGHIREGDVAGFEIPARYFQFVRTGDARPLEAVFEHNRLDLLSLALVTARAAQLLDEGASGARTAREALGLGRLYERGGLIMDAWRCFARAIELDGEDLAIHAEALRAHAVLSRRIGPYGVA